MTLPKNLKARASQWCARRDSNPQPFDPKSNALSVELRTQYPQDISHTPPTKVPEHGVT